MQIEILIKKIKLDLKKCIGVIGNRNRLIFFTEDAKIISFYLSKNITNKEFKFLLYKFLGKNNILVESKPYYFYDYIFFPSLLDFTFYIKETLINKNQILESRLAVINHFENYYILNLKNYSNSELLDLAYRAAFNHSIFKIGPYLLRKNAIFLVFRKKVSQILNKSLIHFLLKNENKIKRITKTGIAKIDNDLKLKRIYPVFYKLPKVFPREKINLKKIFFEINRRVSPFGVVTNLVKLKPLYKIGNRFNFVLTFTSSPNKYIIYHKPIYAGGIHYNPQIAKLKAFLEAVERYSAGEIKQEELKKIRWIKIKNITESIIGFSKPIEFYRKILCTKCKRLSFQNNNFCFKKDVFYQLI